MTFATENIYLKSAPIQAQRANVTWAIWFLGLLGLTGGLGLILLRYGAAPSIIAWLLYLVGVGAILYRPRYGIYLVVFLALVGDAILIYWFPFTSNLSSRESLLFLHDAVIISPLESYLVLIFISWLGRAIVQRKLDFHFGSLFWPSMAFLLFVVVGLVYGLGTGGNVEIALWESRPIFYLPMMLVLTSNLLTKRQHVVHVAWAVMLALFIEGLVGVHHYFIVLEQDLSLVEAITEHSAAIHMNTLFIFFVGLWLYRSSLTSRIVLFLMLPPVALTYLVTQRRAAFVALAIALMLTAIILFFENRTAFWLIMPPLAIVGLVYIAIFWNSSGALAMPAQAIKSVIATDQASAKDQSSNVYRMIENVNSSFTIHQKPLTGVGFGQKFYLLVPLPDISFFIWWEYITHNSIIWIWMKTGVGGFFAMLYLIGTAVTVGVRVLWRLPRNQLSAIAMTMLLYIVMHFVYAYVDMSWDNQSMIYVGLAMGLINSLESIVNRPVPVEPKRWPWQQEPQTAEGLRPLTIETTGEAGN